MLFHQQRERTYLEEREIEGGRVSIVRIRELSRSGLSMLKLPNASVNL